MRYKKENISGRAQYAGHKTQYWGVKLSVDRRLLCRETKSELVQNKDRQSLENVVLNLMSPEAYFVS